MNWKFWKKNKTAVKKKKSVTREWVDAIVFAVIAATLIRTFFIEAYTIPTPSMESSLLVGDFLFVSKVNYGARIPETPVAFPFAHHTMPLINTKAYWDGIQLPYYRLPGLSTVKRGDVVVFNYPMEADSPYYRPVDKRENYIKRCQGIAGDTLTIVDAQVFVNGKPNAIPPASQPEYIVHTNGTPINPEILTELHISIEDQNSTPTDLDTRMTRQAAAVLKSYSNVLSVKEKIATKDIPDVQYPVFPASQYQTKDHLFTWNADNYGPIIIPKKGWTVKLDTLNLPVYRRAIEVYEHNKITHNGTDIMINGVKTNSYTFKMNYYWMMGDNRHDSADSRYWGFVPEDHIVGKALFVWMSWDENGSFLHKIRWSRLFMGIHSY